MSPSTRRQFLGASGVAGVTATAGCLDRLLARAEYTPPEQVSLTVKAPIADDDAVATTIASHFVENLEAAGIDARLEVDVETELYHDVLMNGSYEVFVGRHPGLDEPDALRPMLHSQFVSEQGWQNPFNFSDVDVDTTLDTQVSERGDRRRATLTSLFESLVQRCPFTAVAFPDHHCVVGGRVDHSRPIRSVSEYLELLEQPLGPGEEPRTLRVGLLEYGFTERYNPLTVQFGESTVVVELLYDPLVRRRGDEFAPWLAESVDWIGGDDETVARVTLRERASWHDGAPITAEDVQFTYAFLDDTSLGAVEDGVPAPRYRDRTSLVDTVRVRDERTVDFDFAGRASEVVTRALTVPILPQHVWEERSTLVDEYLTEALIWPNRSPIGSGLARFVDAHRGGFVRLEPFEEHVLWAPTDEDSLARGGGPRRYDALELVVSPNVGSAVNGLGDGSLDLVGTPISPMAIEQLPDDVSLLSEPSSSFYVVGFNVREGGLSNPQFRRALSAVIDRAFVVQEVLGGRGRAADAHHSLVGIDPGTWDDSQRTHVPAFPGEDGDVDANEVRALFRRAGFKYNSEDQLVSR